MAEQNSEQVEAVILDSGDGQTLVADLPGDEGEGENAGKSEAVAIAEIHAETEIAVTAINADVEQARIEAENERVRICQEMDAENAALRASMTEREREIAELRAQLSQAEANQSTGLIPTPQVEEAAEAAAEAVTEALGDGTAPELNLTPQSIAENEPPVESGPSVEEESAAVALAVAVPARRRRRLI
jgi:hypothetical protein